MIAFLCDHDTFLKNHEYGSFELHKLLFIGHCEVTGLVSQCECQGMLCSFWPVDNIQIWLISHGLHYWCTAVTLCTKCRPNSQSYKICAWNVLNIQLSRNNLKNWRGHIINLISMANYYLSSKVKLLKYNVLFPSKLRRSDMSMSSVISLLFYP